MNTSHILHVILICHGYGNRKNKRQIFFCKMNRLENISLCLHEKLKNVEYEEQMEVTAPVHYALITAVDYWTLFQPSSPPPSPHTLFHLNFTESQTTYRDNPGAGVTGVTTGDQGWYWPGYWSLVSGHHGANYQPQPRSHNVQHNVNNVNIRPQVMDRNSVFCIKLLNFWLRTQLTHTA